MRHPPFEQIYRKPRIEVTGPGSSSSQSGSNTNVTIPDLTSAELISLEARVTALESGAAIYNQTFEDEGTPVTQRANVTFIGAGVTVSDVGGKTQVSIPGGAGEAFPVGSIFLATVSTDPATLLGYGTWSALAAGKVLVGYAAGDSDFGTAGASVGAKTVASAGTNSEPTFTGSALGSHSHGAGTYATSAHAGTAVDNHAAHTHSVTSNVAVGAHTPTQPTIAWPAGVPTASGTAVSDHAAHTHSVTSNVAVDNHASHTHTYTQVVNHTHPQTSYGTSTGGSTGWTVDTSMSGSTTTATQATGNPSGGVATGTTAGPDATQTHGVTNNAVTSGNPSATLTHTVSAQPTIAWPAGVPTASGGGVDAHSVTNNAVTSGNPSATLTHSVTQPSDHTMSGSSASVSAGTPAGSVSAPTFTGSATSVIQPSFVCYMWERTA